MPATMAHDHLRWPITGRTPGDDYRIFSTERVVATHPSAGHPHDFSLVRCGDWVNVVAVTEQDHVVMLWQWRAGLDRVCLEVPGGMIDPGEDPLTAARRELEEETGFTAQTWKKLGAIGPNPAMQTNTLHTYLATGARRTHAPRPDGGEALQVELWSWADVRTALTSGTIDHALVVAAFAHAAFAGVGELTPRSCGAT